MSTGDFEQTIFDQTKLAEKTLYEQSDTILEFLATIKSSDAWNEFPSEYRDIMEKSAEVLSTACDQAGNQFKSIRVLIGLNRDHRKARLDHALKLVEADIQNIKARAKFGF